MEPQLSDSKGRTSEEQGPATLHTRARAMSTLRRVSSILILIVAPLALHNGVLLVSYYLGLPPLAHHVRQFRSDLQRCGVDADEVDSQGKWLDGDPARMDVYRRFLAGIDRAAVYEAYGLTPLVLLVSCLIARFLAGYLTITQTLLVSMPYLIWEAAVSGTSAPRLGAYTLSICAGFWLVRRFLPGGRAPVRSGLS